MPLLKLHFEIIVHRCSLVEPEMNKCFFNIFCVKTAQNKISGSILLLVAKN